MSKQPIIIIGMHRSGTSMLTRFISEIGIFMGEDKSENDESKFFQNLNRWLLFQCGASWDNPNGVDNINNSFINNSAKIISKRLTSIWSVKFLGIGNYLKFRNVFKLQEAWGWKDPRNTLLLPIYKKIFPNAKIIHIYRNPIDVANSLKQREGLKKSNGNIKRKKLKTSFLEYERVISHSLVVNDITRGVNLWKFYTQKALKANDYFDDVLHIKYEDFLEAPKDILMTLTKFLEMKVNQDLIDKVASKTDANRRYAFKDEEELYNYYDKIKNDPMLIELGYNNI